uniref:Uncharacterized protein n=1 Tax=Culex tarsalis TaxID=7177 RepID=A0A1Q3FV31_CULTA
MTHQIDTSPPILFVDNVLRATKLVHDIRRQCRVAQENKELLKRINRINRTQGFLGIDYKQQVKKSLNWEARQRESRKILRQNLTLLERILNVIPEIRTADQEKFYQNQIKYRKICATYPSDKPKTIRRYANNYHCPCVLMKIWERDDRYIGSLEINIFEQNTYNFLIKEGINLVRGQIHRIYKDQFIVIRGHLSAPEANRSKQKHLIEHVQRGSLVAAVINEQPAILLTLTNFRSLANCKLLGVVADASGKTMDLLNSYGTTNGRLLEPLRFRLKINY